MMARAAWYRAGRVGIMALALVACGSGSGAPWDQKSTDSLEVLSWWTSGSEHAALQSLYDAFGASHEGVQLADGAVAGGGGSNVQIELASRLRSGEPPDVWQTFVGASLKALADRDLVVDIGHLYDEGLSRAMAPSILEAVTVSGRQYGVPSGSHRQNVLWYNPKVLGAAGVETPADGYTMAQWLKDLDTVSASGVDGLCLGARDRFTVAELFEDILLGTTGAFGWSSISGDRFDWNGDQAQAALGTFGAVLDHVGPGADARSWDQAVGRFADGECGFLAMNNSVYGELVSRGAVPGEGFGSTAFPGTDAYLAVVDTFVLAVGAENRRNGYDFLATVADPVATLAFNRLKGSVPVRTDVDVLQPVALPAGGLCQAHGRRGAVVDHPWRTDAPGLPVGVLRRGDELPHRPGPAVVREHPLDCGEREHGPHALTPTPLPAPSPGAGHLMRAPASAGPVLLDPPAPAPRAASGSSAHSTCQPGSAAPVASPALR